MELLRAQVDTFNRMYWIMSGEILILDSCSCCGTETQGNTQTDSENYLFRCKCGHEWSGHEKEI